MASLTAIEMTQKSKFFGVHFMVIIKAWVWGANEASKMCTSALLYGGVLKWE